jgi:hypothetical protein
MKKSQAGRIVSTLSQRVLSIGAVSGFFKVGGFFAADPATCTFRQRLVADPKRAF